MTEYLFKHGVNIIVHGIFAIVFFAFWWRTRFWLPKYAHVLAAIAFIVSLWVIFTIPNEAPINQKGPVIKALSVFMLPAMVYFFFIFYGGQKEAFKNRIEKLKQCPYCDFPLESLQEEDGTDGQKCHRCGNLLYTINQK